MAVITKCSPSDLHVLQSVAIEAYTDHYRYLWHDQGEHYIRVSFNLETLQSELNSEVCGYYLVSDADIVHGYFKLNYNSSYTSSISQALLELERIYFLAKSIGRGLGTAALSFTEELASDLGCHAVWLKTMKNGKAVVFYQKMGYKIIAEDELKFPGVKNELSEMLVMLKTI